MLLDRDLLAGHPLPHDETAWDSIWDSMSQVLSVSDKKLREQLQKLRSYPLKSAGQALEELATIEKFLDDLSHILLEMTDLAPLACLSTG